ncbi:hypothetical protein G6F60_004995 [Rhizopus arrhizus]|uniref:Transmembrane protein n=1 Tax=Rhizopus oryzae TaxID=64495 RepID=A0A9P6XCI5_RHIOR|nr:hypothetical protein G6F24_004604 [Rhizopus arrhizus]KAG0918707.1 hypothetical protein G6F33_000320 [Rhizopus arrhizus]KAG0950668.1 hypothetical protein G6F32_005103 [Rhizopus arrhizus]KAG1295182.1 hypothetical protein G6F66_004565 [Rhizopus arrhizus]KAG1310212.1 hypothetical protein G6F64_004733 [Rhizopus arrhizus]
MAPVPSVSIITMAIQGASAYAGAELAIRSLFPKKNNILFITMCKFVLGFSMAIKTAIFLAFHASLGEVTCEIIGRIADFFYHLAMAAGTAVMLSRVQAITPIQWKKTAAALHILLVILRFAIGIVDIVVVTITVHDTNTCKYKNAKYWGPVYTLYDTSIDIYVTCIISAILIMHIRSLTFGDMRISITLYTSVIYNNVIRTFLLTIVNIISAAFIFTSNGNKYTMIVWPVTNIGFILLVGYDSDVTKTIQKLRQGHWRQTASNSNIGLRQVPHITRPACTKERPVSREILNDPENQRYDTNSDNSSTLHIEKTLTDEHKHHNIGEEDNVQLSDERKMTQIDF